LLLRVLLEIHWRQFDAQFPKTLNSGLYTFDKVVIVHQVKAFNAALNGLNAEDNLRSCNKRVSLSFKVPSPQLISRAKRLKAKVSFGHDYAPKTLELDVYTPQIPREESVRLTLPNSSGNFFLSPLIAQGVSTVPMASHSQMKRSMSLFQQAGRPEPEGTVFAILAERGWRRGFAGASVSFFQNGLLVDGELELPIQGVNYGGTVIKELVGCDGESGVSGQMLGGAIECQVYTHGTMLWMPR